MKHPYHIASVLITGFMLWSGISSAQQIPVDSLTKKFDAYRRQTLQEKIYLHIDRSTYLTGETMWFKVYLTDASFHKPLSMSGVVYVEILDKTHQAVLQTKVALTNGSGNGSLFLPASISSGNFQVRAYTRWMKNFSPEFFFHKTISIVNTFKRIEKEISTKAASPDVQFFPEGGDLIAGVKSKIAFRAVDPSGKGIGFRGALLNEQNDTVARFRPRVFGIGNFTFVPSATHTYRAIVTDESGKRTTHKFPAVRESGHALHVQDTTADRIALTITARTNDPTSDAAVYVFVHARQIMVHASLKYLQGGSGTIVLEKKNIPEGISQITVFDVNMKPVCERLYFKQPEKKLSIAIQPDESTYVSRRRVRVDLETAQNTMGTPANVSVSVYKTDSIPAHGGSIADYFWLTSDLKGAVESPEYYLDPASPGLSETVDNLMLTHGWRRFQWNDVLSRRVPAIKFIPEYHGHIVNGIVHGTDGSPTPGILTYLSSPGRITRLYGSRSNQQGDVYFEMQKFSGSASVVVQTNPKRDSLYRVEITSPFSDQFAVRPIPPLELKSTLQNTLLERSVAMQVNDIYYPQKFKAATVDSSAFFGPPDEKYRLDDFTRFPVMEEVMREYVPGVLVRKRKDGFHFLVIDDVHKGFFSETPLIMIDGVPIFDEDEIMAFDPVKIQKLEVITKQYYLGPLVFPGVVSYTTYKGDLSDFPLNPKSVKLNYEGLQLQREFYSPRYESQSQRESRMPDARTLLYWNPEVLTGADGKQQIEFYTSDVSGKYYIVVEGMTIDGGVGSSTKTITVNSPHN